MSDESIIIDLETTTNDGHHNRKETGLHSWWKVFQPVTMRLDRETVSYFKSMSEETGIPDLSLINLCLRDSAVTNESTILFACFLAINNLDKHYLVACSCLIHQALKRVRWIEPLHLQVRDQSQRCILVYGRSNNITLLQCLTSNHTLNGIFSDTRNHLEKSLSPGPCLP